MAVFGLRIRAIAADAAASDQWSLRFGPLGYIQRGGKRLQTLRDKIQKKQQQNRDDANRRLVGVCPTYWQDMLLARLLGL